MALATPLSVMLASAFLPGALSSAPSGSGAKDRVRPPGGLALGRLAGSGAASDFVSTGAALLQAISLSTTAFSTPASSAISNTGCGDWGVRGCSRDAGGGGGGTSRGPGAAARAPASPTGSRDGATGCLPCGKAAPGKDGGDEETMEAAP